MRFRPLGVSATSVREFSTLFTPLSALCHPLGQHTEYRHHEVTASGCPLRSFTDLPPRKPRLDHLAPLDSQARAPGLSPVLYSLYPRAGRGACKSRPARKAGSSPFKVTANLTLHPPDLQNMHQRYPSHRRVAAPSPMWTGGLSPHTPLSGSGCPTLRRPSGGTLSTWLRGFKSPVLRFLPA